MLRARSRVAVLQGLCDGPVTESALEGVMERVVSGGFGHEEVMVSLWSFRSISVRSYFRLVGALLLVCAPHASAAIQTKFRL